MIKMNFDFEGLLDLNVLEVFTLLTVFNAWTYTQIHIPTVVQGGGRGGGWNPSP